MFAKCLFIYFFIRTQSNEAVVDYRQVLVYKNHYRNSSKVEHVGIMQPETAGR